MLGKEVKVEMMIFRDKTLIIEKEEERLIKGGGDRREKRSYEVRKPMQDNSKNNVGT